MDMPIPQIKDTGCATNNCLGSHIWPKSHRTCKPNGEPRGKEEMKEKAEEYLKQYYDSRKQSVSLML